MKVVHGLDSLDAPLDRSVLSIGNFDGVHRAHQQLLAQAGLLAANAGCPVVVLTFEPHPLSIVAPGKAPARISTFEQKLRWLAEAGADMTVVARSDRSLLGMEPEQFVRDVVIERFHPAHIVEGPSFGFGKGRRGNVDTLRAVAGEYGCDVHVLEPVRLELRDRERVLVSSSMVRKLLTEGMVHRAALCLGRQYELIGEVVRGDGRGRGIGFPTANLRIDEGILVPGDGVYSGSAQVAGRQIAAAISIGSRATFGSPSRAIEAHLLDFDGDLYGATMVLHFGRFLRAQEKFSGVDALQAQLQRDCEEVRKQVAAHEE